MGKWLKIVLGIVGVLVVLGGGGYFWATGVANARLAERYEAHDVDFPIPFPLSPAELEALRIQEGVGPDGADPDEAGTEVAGLEGAPLQAAVPDKPNMDFGALALERALARGKHLVESRYACTECHGKDFSGGVMIDDPLVGRLLGPNLTHGKGSVVRAYTAADWDRLVRHGIKPDGRATVMPSEDFFAMSDQELSDIIAYIRSLPPVDNVVSPTTLGPLGVVLVATDQIHFAAKQLKDHHAAHAQLPPPADDTLAFGKHLAQVCTGCHNPSLSGGPMPGAPPDWAEPTNLTTHAEGLVGWTLEDFTQVMRTGRRPDGSEVALPMSLSVGFTQRMTDEEIQALWAYLESLPALPTGG